jgi:predicted O-linked N-acetylglucosamine transferase (SPINDLY family)
MSAITWLNEAYQYLLQGQYEQVAVFYERCLEEESEIVEHYWYLGLAYLLLGQEEQAQLTWFVVLGQCEGDEVEIQTNVLCQILETEAERQENKKNYDLAWLVRGHIRELDSENYNNLFQFICLELNLSSNPSKQLDTWHISELLPSISTEKITQETFMKFLKVVLSIPSWDSLYFVRYYLELELNNQKLLAFIYDNINQFWNQPEHSSYIVKILQICLEFDTQKLRVIDAIIALYNRYSDLESCIKFAKIFIETSKTSTEKIYGYYRLLYSLLKSSDWNEASYVAEQYFQCLEKFYLCPIDTSEIFIQNALIALNQPLFYLRDNPRKDRLLANYISQVFQEVFQHNSSIRVLPFSNEKTSLRPLRIGYIASTLNAHPVGYLSRWLIYHSNRNEVKNYAYLFCDYKDSLAEDWFISTMENYHLLGGNIEKAIATIQADQIDILVDLDSLTLDLTCQVLALKPAPIQVTWLGFDATGIPNVDYFIADPYVLPTDADQYYSEKIWRLPGCYLGIDGFEIGVPTLRREDLGIENDAIIFMNFQNALKRHPHIIHQQMKILKAVPHSYLLVKGTGKADEIQKLFEGIAQEQGLPLDRLHFLEPCSTEMEHRANLGIADVVLDTYPYNGATTTLETLWMEIPIVTKVGEQFAARNSYTFMINAGITEGIARSDEAYVEWGIKLGTDQNLRREISDKLRQGKKNLSLWNGKQFAREMENAYRQMWEIYVKEN